MAKLCMINREKKRKLLVEKYASKRMELKKIIRSLKCSEEERSMARDELNQLPRDSARIRLRNRCGITGRPRGYYRKFGLSRNKLRELAMSGDIPGVVKASW